MSHLTKLLKNKRESLGLSLKEVADYMGFSNQAHISKWEKNESHPPVSYLKRLAEFYKISPDDLFEAILSDMVASHKN